MFKPSQGGLTRNPPSAYIHIHVGWCAHGRGLWFTVGFLVCTDNIWKAAPGLIYPPSDPIHKDSGAKVTSTRSSSIRRPGILKHLSSASSSDAHTACPLVHVKDWDLRRSMGKDRKSHWARCRSFQFTHPKAGALVVHLRLPASIEDNAASAAPGSVLKRPVEPAAFTLEVKMGI